jgi:hypothetical protein
MKKLIFIISLLVSNISLGAGNPTSGNPTSGTPTLNEEISNKLILDLSMVELDKKHQDFVLVSFYICNDEIEITEISGSQEELVEKVKIKLSQLKIEQMYDEGALYRYKFTFEKG